MKESLRIIEQVHDRIPPGPVNVKLPKVVRPPAGPVDWTADPGLGRMLAFVETKTVWHPKGV